MNKLQSPDLVSEISSVNEMDNKSKIYLSRIYRCEKAAFTAIIHLSIEYKVTKTYLGSCCQVNTNYTSLSAPGNA